MKAIVVLLAICLVSEIQCTDMCTTLHSTGSCKLTEDCDGEIKNYGSYICPGKICCVAPDTTTPEPTTEPPSTEPPSTTEEPTTLPPTTVLPVTEQCGVRPVDDQMFRILGGAEKAIRDWPWKVSVQGKDLLDVTDLLALAGQEPSQSNMKHICAGVFIHEQYVVTTGFCIMKLYALFKSTNTVFDQFKNILVKAGETTINTHDFDTSGSSTEKQLKVIEIIPHPGFPIQDFQGGAYTVANLIDHADIFSPNNLVVLKLEQPVVFNENVRKSCAPNLTESATCSLKKSGCVVAGWGDQSESGTVNDGTLKDAVVEVFSKDVVDAAAQITSNPPAALQSVAKFTTPPGNVCDGDNGGMVVCKNDEGRWALEGLVSIANVGGGCQSADSFNIVDIHAAWPWIASTINV